MRKLLPIAFALAMMLSLSANAQDQMRVLKGVVTASTDGLPMPGVTILDKSNQSL